ncbi:MAG: MFS transporter [Rhodospirillales bacterium]
MNHLTGLRLWSFAALFTSFIAVTYGFGVYLFPAIAPEMIKDIGFTYSEMGVSTGAAQASFLLCALLAGFVTNKVGAFNVIKISLCVCVFSLLALIWAGDFFVISIFLILMGGAAASVWVPMVEVVQKHVPSRQRGMILGLMSSGTSYGVFVNSILIFYFLSSFGWRSLWIAVFLITVMICVAAFFMMRRLETADKHAETPAPGDNDGFRDVKIMERIRTLPKGVTSVIMLMMFLNGMSCIPFQTYLSSFLFESYGLASDETATAWRLIGAVGMFAGFVMGFIADRITVKWTLTVVYCFLSVSTAVLLYAAAFDFAVYAAAVLFGLSFYPIFGLLPAYISHMYKSGAATLVFAFGSTALGTGGVVGNSVGGWLRQETGAFEWTYMFILAASLGSLVLSLFMRSEKKAAPQSL